MLAWSPSPAQPARGRSRRWGRSRRTIRSNPLSQRSLRKRQVHRPRPTRRRTRGKNSPNGIERGTGQVPGRGRPWMGSTVAPAPRRALFPAPISFRSRAVCRRIFPRVLRPVIRGKPPTAVSRHGDTPGRPPSSVFSSSRAASCPEPRTARVVP